MILLPIGHEETGVRRLPWVTFAIMGICLPAFVASGRAGLVSDDDVRLTQDANDAIEYYFSHPYLELDLRFEKLAFPDGTDEQLTALRETFGLATPSPPGEDLIRSEQEELNGLTTRALSS